MRDTGRWVCCDIISLCTYLSINGIVVQCNIIYMVFSMSWCSSYINNLWNEGAWKSIMTITCPSQRTDSMHGVTQHKISSQDKLCLAHLLRTDSMRCKSPCVIGQLISCVQILPMESAFANQLNSLWLKQWVRARHIEDEVMQSGNGAQKFQSAGCGLCGTLSKESSICGFRNASLGVSSPGFYPS